MKSPALAKALVGLSLFAAAAAFLAPASDDWRDSLKDSQDRSARDSLSRMAGGSAGALPDVAPRPSAGEIDSSGARPDVDLKLIDVKGVEIQSGEIRKPEGGGEEEGDDIDIKDPCPRIIRPLERLSQLKPMPRQAALGNDAYDADTVGRFGKGLASLMEYCQAGNMRVIKQSIDAVRGSAVYAKGQAVPAAGAVDKAQVDRLLSSSLRLIYKFDPHLDPKNGRPMDPYR